MKRAWQIASLAFLLMSILVILHSLEYSYNDSLGPGPGFFPFWLGLIAGGLSLGLLLQSSLSKELLSDTVGLFPEREGLLRILYILIGLFGVLVLLNTLGFRLCMLLFLVVLPLALGVRSWWFVLMMAVAGSFGVFHVFYYYLKLPLPIGIFGV